MEQTPITMTNRVVRPILVNSRRRKSSLVGMIPLAVMDVNLKAVARNQDPSKEQSENRSKLLGGIGVGKYLLEVIRIIR